MYTVTRELSFSYGHRLLRHEGKCGRLHGHNGRLRVTLASTSLDNAGMVVDFFDIKKALSGWIDETLDHRLILQREDPAAAALEAIGEPIYTVDFPPTSENLTRHVLEHLRRIGLPVVEVSLDETENCSATYRDPGEGLSH
jgi:6-pyruvoyltetrahydropterin/6-carboxytetrahydropterin synthase